LARRSLQLHQFKLTILYMPLRSRFILKSRPVAGALDIEELALPGVGRESVIVKICYAAICGTDLHLYRWNKWAARNYVPPFPLGHEFSGEVVEIGSDVTKVKVGDRICAETHIACGNCQQCRMNRQHTCLNLKLFSKHGWGCFSDYTVVPQGVLRKVPSEIPLNKAVIMEPLGVSVRAIMDVDVRGGNLLVTGCGPIGLFAIAAARAFGASRIIASDPAHGRTKLAQEIGADAIIDPRGACFRTQIQEATSGEGIDVAIETSGYADAIQGALVTLRPGGHLVLLGLSDEEISLDFSCHIVLREISVRGVYGRLLDKTWLQVERLLRSSAINVDTVITHYFALEQFNQAFCLAASESVGKIVFEMN